MHRYSTSAECMSSEVPLCRVASARWRAPRIADSETESGGQCVGVGDTSGCLLAHAADSAPHLHTSSHSPAVSNARTCVHGPAVKRRIPSDPIWNLPGSWTMSSQPARQADFRGRRPTPIAARGRRMQGPSRRSVLAAAAVVECGQPERPARGCPSRQALSGSGAPWMRRRCSGDGYVSSSSGSTGASIVSGSKRAGRRGT